uniref:Uncharacterized protein n=1 Tax=Anguilla anguilla TaxID=7936 RepID=A0A0E9QJS1_ANGAN
MKVTQHFTKLKNEIKASHSLILD